MGAGGGVVADTAEGEEGSEEAAVDGGSGFAVELLVNDGFDKGFEGGLEGGDAELAGRTARNQTAKTWVSDG